MRRLIKRELENTIDTGSRITFGELKNGLMRDAEIDQEFLANVPTNDFGTDENETSIIGSRELIQEFAFVDENKFDDVYPLGKIAFEKFKDEEIILTFNPGNPEYEFEVIGAYKFTNQFLNIFKMASFAHYCFENDEIKLIENDLGYLLEKNHDLRYQYRFIVHENETFARCHTSIGYNNFDNRFAIYTALLFAEKYCLAENKEMYVKKAELNDSDIKIYFEEFESQRLSDIGNVRFGMLIENSEITERNFTITLTYTLLSNSGKELNILWDQKILKMKHNMHLENVYRKIQTASPILEQQEQTLEYLNQLIIVPNIFDTIKSYITAVFENDKEFSSEVRRRVAELSKNTENALDFFFRINDVSEEIDDKIALQMFIHKTIKNILK